MELTEPEFVKRSRSINVEWLLGETLDDKGLTIRHLAVLTCMHHGRREMYNQPEYCFTAGIGVETDTDRGNGIHSRGFRVYAGMSLIRQDGENRFSMKRLEEFAQSARRTVELMLADDSDDDERIVRLRTYFVPVDQEYCATCGKTGPTITLDHGRFCSYPCGDAAMSPPCSEHTAAQARR